jgi:phospholipid/cholesterol/gamma-HCH transport system permease protein
VAELGSMRISDEIDALEVMGIPSVTFLCATRLLAPGWCCPSSTSPPWGPASSLLLAVVVADRRGVVGGFFLIFWMFQNPPDLLFSVIKGMVMATAIVLVGCYYGYHAGGGPVGVGTRHREVHGGQHRARAPHRDARHPGLLGRQPAAPIGG